MRMLKWSALLGLVLSLSACASSRPQMSELEKRQYAYSAAIRWGDFEGAWSMVDPKYREQNPMTELEFSRYQQVQVSGYRDLAAQAVPERSAVREIQIGVINKNTMAERTLRYTEQWRYDAEAKTWWITDGLPDFWKGE